MSADRTSIIELWQLGYYPWEIAERHGISSQRVLQIVESFGAPDYRAILARLRGAAA